ncbi:MAG: hypothetical protein AAGN46_00900 [Acidobacteriota bacterium]
MRGSSRALPLALVAVFTLAACRTSLGPVGIGERPAGSSVATVEVGGAPLDVILARSLAAEMEASARGDEAAPGRWALVRARSPLDCVEDIAEGLDRAALAWGVEGALATALFWGRVAALDLEPPRRGDRADDALDRFEAARAAVGVRESELVRTVGLDLAIRLFAIRRVSMLRASRARFSRLAETGDAEAIYWHGFVELLTAREERAAAAFARLASLRPEDAEVALRLGVARRRAGEDRAALPAFEAAVAAPGPAWARLLAFQEIVKLLDDGFARSERPADVWLERGREEFPRDHGLERLRAARAEQLGQVVAVNDALAQLEIVDSAASDSELGAVRLRFDRPTTTRFEERLATLDVRLSAAADGLAAALATAVDNVAAEAPRRACERRQGD